MMSVSSRFSKIVSFLPESGAIVVGSFDCIRKRGSIMAMLPEYLTVLMSRHLGPY